MATPSTSSSFARTLRDSSSSPAMISKSSTASFATTSDTPLHNPTIQFYCSLLSGICSGAVSSILVAPLDVIRTRLQVLGATSGTATPGQVVANIIRNEGISGFFRGLAATLVTVPAFWGVYFPLYEDFKHRGKSHNLHPALLHMGSAISAGGMLVFSMISSFSNNTSLTAIAIADVMLNPMFVVRTRLQTEALYGNTQSTILRTVRTLYQEGGLPVFWRGMAANLLGLSHVAVQFPIYEHCKSLYSTDPSTPLTPVQLLTASALSKLCASVLTYPHEVIRSRMMDSRTPISFLRICRNIYTTQGFRGFYAGLPVSVLRVVPNTAVAFCVYELALHEMKQIAKQRNWW